WCGTPGSRSPKSASARRWSSTSSARRSKRSRRRKPPRPMRVEVDISGVEARTERALRELSPSLVLGVMVPPLRDAAAQERETHLYRNRTGDLQRSTGTEILEVSPERVSVSLQMMMPYAEFVWRKGLSDLDGYGAEAAQKIQRGFAEQRKRIAG